MFQEEEEEVKVGGEEEEWGRPKTKCTNSYVDTTHNYLSPLL